jgi:ABC-type branched-subunit amino acid transport system substrate-binding protein
VVERSARSPLLRRRAPRTLVTVLGAALTLAGCGTATTGGTSAVTVSGKTLTIYASQPPGGAQSQPASDILTAEKLAFSQSGGKVGSYTIHFKVLTGAKLSDNARTAVEDQKSIAYLGELVPGTSQVSVQILNQQGLLEVSPADTAVYLTQPVPPVSNTTDTFYPAHATYKQTFARVVPNSGPEAKAVVQELGAEHVTSLFVADDGQLYGAALALEVRNAAKTAGVTLATSAAGAGAVFYGGSVANAPVATRFLDQTASASPKAKLFVPSGLYDSSFVAGLSAGAQARLTLSSPGFLPKDLTGDGPAFASTFRTDYGHAPAPQAVFGYEAMRAVLATLAQAGTAANNRAVVVAGFRSLKRTSGSALGAYSISGGDPSIAPFVFAHIGSRPPRPPRPAGGAAGSLVAFKFVQLAG